MTQPAYVVYDDADMDQLILSRLRSGKHVQPARVATLMFNAITTRTERRFRITSTMKELALKQLHTMAQSRVQEVKRRTQLVLRQSAALGRSLNSNKLEVRDRSVHVA